MNTRFFRISIAALLLAAASNGALAEQGGRFGTSSGGARAPITLGRINPAFNFNNAQVATGGVGLRNRGAGGIEVSGLTGTGAMRAAFLYWAVITTGAPPVASKRLQLQRLFPTPASVNTTIVGTVVGTGPSPCWNGDTITVFRGAPSTALVTGNGFYAVRLLAGAAGITNGQDPFQNQAVPQFDGASLVAVTDGSDIISLYDQGLAGKTFFNNPGLVYSLVTPAPVNTSPRVRWRNIGADGQRSSNAAFVGVPEAGNELTSVNNVKVAGDGAPDRDSDWNGSSGKPVTQLWDDTAHDVTTAAHSGAVANLLTVKFNRLTPAGNSDCLTPVANVVERQ